MEASMRPVFDQIPEAELARWRDMSRCHDPPAGVDPQVGSQVAGDRQSRRQCGRPSDSARPFAAGTTAGVGCPACLQLPPRMATPVIWSSGTTVAACIASYPMMRIQAAECTALHQRVSGWPDLPGPQTRKLVGSMGAARTACCARSFPSASCCLRCAYRRCSCRCAMAMHPFAPDAGYAHARRRQVDPQSLPLLVPARALASLPRARRCADVSSAVSAPPPGVGRANRHVARVARTQSPRAPPP